MSENDIKEDKEVFFKKFSDLENFYEEDKPKQYQIGIDTFERARANMSKEEIIACCKFNIDKYCWRKKGQDISDFMKIKDYCNFAIDTLMGEK